MAGAGLVLPSLPAKYRNGRPFPAGIPDDGGSKVPRFIWPGDVTLKSKYRLLGNSVNVEVVRRLLNYLFEDGGLE